MHVLDIILPINSDISYFIHLGFQNHKYPISRAQNLIFPFDKDLQFLPYIQN